MAVPFCTFKNLAGSKLGLILNSQECANTFVNCCKSSQPKEDQGIIVAISKGESQIQHTYQYPRLSTKL
jgi:hypothetical protein